VPSRNIPGMIQRAEAPDVVAVEASTRIAEAIRPWRIVLFGSRARGTAKNDSDYDFYVEVDADEDDLRDIESRARKSAYRDGLSFDLKVVRRGSLERRRDDPGTIEWDVAREGKVLYADPDAPASIAPPGRVREQPQKTPESVAEWIESAERDVRHADLLWRAPETYWPEICWLSHQMCEKLMKALLVCRFVRPERTHDLTRLLRMLREDGSNLGPLDAECQLLSKHAITPRYPAGMHLTEQDARDASTAAERVMAAIRARLPQ
jgi:HEPN domain-containing protein/predicted nucleotidyltransferase